MDEKQTFGAYIRAKRQQAGLTQKQLADSLFLSESTVSKWERGLSYPDVALIPGVCRALGISEHEFFMACDDENAAAQARAAAVWRGVLTGWRWFCAAAYLIALLVCLICDLVIFHTLDWFWIVLTAIALAFCFTNLPFHVTRHRLPVCLGAATGCLLLLLLACWLYAGGFWLGGAIAITAVCLALPWGVWAIWRFYGKHVLPLAAALASVWVFALLAVIRLFAGGSWLLSLAYPVAAAGVAFFWALFACLYWLPAGPWLKAGAFALVASFATPAINSLCALLLPEQHGPAFLDYFAWGNLLSRQDIGDFSWINILAFVLTLAVSAALLAAGVILEVRRRRLR